MHVGETLTDLQILSCELHKMPLAAWLRPDPLGELYRSLRLLAVIRGEGEGKGWE